VQATAPESNPHLHSERSATSSLMSQPRCVTVTWTGIRISRDVPADSMFSAVHAPYTDVTVNIPLSHVMCSVSTAGLGIRHYIR
jgi:hypothetical protein